MPGVNIVKAIPWVQPALEIRQNDSQGPEKVGGFLLEVTPVGTVKKRGIKHTGSY